MDRPPEQPDFWTVPQAELFSSLRATPAGLDDAEAARRRATSGTNELHPAKKRLLIWEYLRKLGNPLVLILLFASLISALTGDKPSFLIITAVVLMSVTLDFVQEHRAGQAAAKLQQTVAVLVNVLRGGTLQKRQPWELVPGDVVEVSAGDLIPADLRLLEAGDLFVNQSLVTGESFPVEKRPVDRPAGKVELATAENAAFMGSSVVSGHGRAIVCRTGSRTALGQIASTLATQAPPTSFEQGMNRLSLLLMRVTILLVLFVLFVNLLFHRPALESFLFAVALAVGLTPELLPMIVSVTLAQGAQRMARAQVIVKRPSAIEDLGAMNVLCTDKTGTLTEASIRLEKHTDPDGQDNAQVLTLAWLNSYFETGIRSPLDDAILAHQELSANHWTKIDEVPFDFERRRVSVLIDDGQRRLLVVKGAPEDLLRRCARFWSQSTGEHPLDDAARHRILDRFNGLGRDGYRVLGIACHEVGRDHARAALEDESALLFMGFAAFLDPPKASARAAIAALHAHQVEVKVVTGDNELVTRHVCQQLGLAVRGVLLGSEIEALNEDALSRRAQETTLFCRVSPAQKSRVIRTLRNCGNVVGYLGDGINDAPSLHAADVGISVDSAVDVAKNAADMILLQRDLGVLAAGVLEGRRTFANVMKYLMMATSSNFGNMFSMAVASLALPFLPMLPVQILLNNLIYDISELPIPLDSVDPEALAGPQRWDLKLLERFMVVAGSISSLFDFATFFILLHFLHAGERLFHSGWFVESMATQILVVFVIRTWGSPFRSRPSPVLVWCSLSCLAVAILLPYLPLGRMIGFVPLPPVFLLILLGMVPIYLSLVDAAKRRFHRREVRSGGGGTPVRPVWRLERSDGRGSTPNASPAPAR
jgi:Mg2+-importing ATPase